MQLISVGIQPLHTGSRPIPVTDQYLWIHVRPALRNIASRSNLQHQSCRPLLTDSINKSTAVNPGFRPQTCETRHQAFPPSDLVTKSVCLRTAAASQPLEHGRYPAQNLWAGWLVKGFPRQSQSVNTIMTLFFQKHRYQHKAIRNMKNEGDLTPQKEHNNQPVADPR
jgi:hypothetical protein